MKGSRRRPSGADVVSAAVASGPALVGGFRAHDTPKNAVVVAGVPGTVEEAPDEIHEVAPDAADAAQASAAGALALRAYRMGSCDITVVLPPDGFWILTIERPDTYPTWDEVKVARYRLLPADITVAMLLPPPDEFVNGKRFMFHLCEIGVGT